MLDLFDEFKALIGALEADGVDYAVCGGFAMAIHALARATVDIDLLIQPGDIPEVRRLASALGYTYEAAPMRFRRGEVEIRRFRRSTRNLPTRCPWISCSSLRRRRQPGKAGRRLPGRAVVSSQQRARSRRHRVAARRR